MRKIVAMIAASLIGASLLIASTAATASAAPRKCLSRLVDAHIESRLWHPDYAPEYAFAQFRTVTTYRRHCAGTPGWKLVVVRGPWGPGRR